MKVILNESQFKKLLAEMTSDEINIRANEADVNPTEPQKEAGNYKMGHISVKGMKISIENPKGSYRKYKKDDGTEGRNLMHHHYGYFNVTKGKDGDAVDCFIGPNIENFTTVYCVDQNLSAKAGNHHGVFDETKVMLGFSSIEEAKQAYMANYSPDWDGFRCITAVSLKTFKKWLYRGRKQRQPFANYVEIQKKKLNEESHIADQKKFNEFRDCVESMKKYILEKCETDSGKNGMGIAYNSQTIARLYADSMHSFSFFEKAAARALYELNNTNLYNRKGVK